MTITELNDSFTDIVTHLKTEGHDVQGHLVVAHDGHATIQLKDKQGIWLVVVMPSTTYSGQPDSYQPHDTMMLFVLEKDIDDQARASELQQYQRLQDVLAAIIDYIGEQQAEGCSPWNDFDPSSIEIDPEYREFGGFNGWSMTLSY